jgi:hypothetical protein
MLGVYGSWMPGLDQLDDEARAAIIRGWMPPTGWRSTGAY